MTNPYIPPDAELNHREYGGDAAIHEPNSLPSGRGLSWITEGFNYFKQDVGTWLLVTLVGAVVLIGINTIPVLNFFGGFFTYVFSGGLMLGAKAQHDGQPLTIGHLFAGFQHSFGSLLGLGAVAIGYSILAVIIAFGSMLLKLPEFNLAALQQLFTLETLLFSSILMLVLLTPLFMGVWFAPALIVINKVPLFQAIFMSINGCLKNALPLTLYGLVLALLFIIGTIPLMLGLFVVMPIFYASIFISYREIYIDP